MDLTRDEVEFRAAEHVEPRRRWRRERARPPVDVPRLEHTGRVTQARVVALRVDEAALAALDALVAARRDACSTIGLPLPLRRGHLVALGQHEPARARRPPSARHRARRRERRAAGDRACSACS